MLKSNCQTCEHPGPRHHGKGRGTCDTFKVKPWSDDFALTGFSDGVSPRGEELEKCNCKEYIPSDNLEYVMWVDARKLY